MAKKKNNTNNNKKKNNAEKKKKNTMAPIEGGAKGENQESPAVAVSASSERKPEMELEIKPGLMFSKNLDSKDSEPALSRAAIVVYSDEMERALSLTEEYGKIAYIRVIATDPRSRDYELRFSRNDDAQRGIHEFILHHEWGKMLAENGIKEGYRVLGFGYNRFINNEFRVLLRFLEEPPPENPKQAACFLFEKRMGGAADLKQPAIESCSDKLKMALQITLCRPYIRVFATALPTKKKYMMSFKRHGGEGSFTLSGGWEKMVAEIGVEEGDLVSGTGKIFTHCISMQLSFIKNAAEETTPSNLNGRALLFFEKKLESPDTDAGLGLLVIRSCKDVVKQGIDQELKAEGNNNGYVRVCAMDEGYMYGDLRLSKYVPEEGDQGAIYVVDHQWKDVVTANGLKTGDRIWCWGFFVGDGSIQMKIDIEKA